MATEIAKESVANTMPQGTSVTQAADVISSIMNPKGAPAQPVATEPQRRREPLETPDETPDTPDVEPDASRMEAIDDTPEPVEDTPQEPVEQETVSEQSEGDAAELELEPAQLAALLGLQEQDLVLTEDGSLAFQAKVDGAAMPVALSELRDSYQLTKTAQQRLSKLGEERKAFNDERKRVLEELGKQTDMMAQAIGQMEAEYAADFQGIDWNRLREEDATEYSLKRADFADREKRLQAYRQQFDQQRTEAIQQYQAHQMHLVEEGRQRLNEAMTGPDYADAPAWDENARKELVEFMVNEGVPIELIQSSPVWQAFNWARKAMLYDKIRETATKTAKRVVKLPKVSKPGAQKTKAQVKQGRLREKKMAQRKAGGKLDASADLISAIMRGE